MKESNPLCLSSNADTSNRSHRLTGRREPTPTIRACPWVDKGAIWKLCKSIPLRTTESRLETKRLSERQTVLLAKKLFEIWSRGQRALNRPNNGPDSFLS